MNYFNKLPTIVYNGQVAKNIMARAKLSDRVMANKNAFYPYTMDETDRADTLSQHYYDNVGYTWLIWMANNTVDPYYSMPLTEGDFNNYLISKYGSVAKAMRKIAFYRTKLDKEARITVAAYRSLPSRFMKYYEPVTDNYGNTIMYERNQNLDTTNTNRIVTLTLSTVNKNFTVGEEIQVNGTNYGFITLVDGNTVTCQHVNGTLAEGNKVTGQDSGATGVIESSTTVVQTIAYTDAAYWEPISCYDNEREINEAKKNVKLLDIRYKNQAETELKRLMSTS